MFRALVALVQQSLQPLLLQLALLLTSSPIVGYLCHVSQVTSARHPSQDLTAATVHAALSCHPNPPRGAAPGCQELLTSCRLDAFPSTLADAATPNALSEEATSAPLPEATSERSPQEPAADAGPADEAAKSAAGPS